MPIKLTKNEQKVYEKALLGFNAREIAEIFKRHPQRVQKVMGRIYKKYDVHSIQKLMALRIAELEDTLYKHGLDYD
jgi:DNA-binding CsgD family transcriptional regulator